MTSYRHIVFLSAAAFGALGAGAADAQEAAPPAPEVVVTGSIYRGDVASGGARIDADVKDLPLTIDVLTQALIEDR